MVENVMMLSQQIFVTFVTLFTLTQAYNSKCKSIPGDPKWPTPAEWARLNRTVDGRLLGTVPVATYCHGTKYRKEQCQELKQTWPFADAQ
jgi:hypothetical protein